MESKISIPLDGEKISVNSNLKLNVPNNPIINADKRQKPIFSFSIVIAKIETNNG